MPKEAGEVGEEPQNAIGVRRSNIWLEDGNIVLEAENIQFKVHRGLLAKVSPIFADVFVVPQPAEVDLAVGGCPLLRLQDSAQDIAHLLSGLYDQRYHTKKAIPFDVAAALLRLGRKYEIKPLFQEVVCRLKVDLPTTLNGLDSLPRGVNGREICLEDSLLYKIAKFAYESDIPEIRCILPLTYFWCCCERLDDMIEGYDKMKPFAPEAHRICFVGRQKIVDRFNYVFSWVDILGTGPCTTNLHCSNISRRLMKALWRPEPQVDVLLYSWPDIVKPLPQETPFEHWDLKTLCDPCRNYAQEKYKSFREETWNSLPSYFGLSNWDVFNKDTEENIAQ